MIARCSPFLVFVLASGCVLPRGVIAPGDEAGLPDVGLLDGGVDVDGGPDVDAFRDDTGVEDDAAMPREDTGTCSPTTEICNGIDDDCDGAVDQIGCSACTAPGTCDACTYVTAGGHHYQSCPAVTAHEYWARICWTLGAGYDLATFQTPGEQDAVRLALTAASITDSHWVGLEDRETNGIYYWLDARSMGHDIGFTTVAADPDQAFVALRADGLLETFAGTAENRVLCELGPTVCAATAGDDMTCNGVDDDCDGFVDEDCAGGADCTSRVFGRSVYYRCLTDLSGPEATTECADSGAQLASLTDRFEQRWAADLVSGDAWVGLRQATGAAEPADGWAWDDGTAFPVTDSEWAVSWDTGEPQVSADACGYLQNSDGLLRDGNCGNNRQETICERPVTGH